MPGVRDTGTDINAAFNGEGSLGGLSTQHIGAAGSLSWDWRFLDEKNSASITITRMDSGACSRISLKPNAVAGTYKGNLHVAFPANAQMLSKSAFDIASTIVIDDAGGVTFTFADKGSVSEGANWVTISVDYNAKGSMTGSVSEDVKLDFKGGYSSTYKTNLPGNVAAMMPASQRSLLSGTTSGSSDGTGTISDNIITGSVIFNGAQGGTSTGTYKVEKVSEQSG